MKGSEVRESRVSSGIRKGFKEDEEEGGGDENTYHQPDWQQRMTLSPGSPEGVGEMEGDSYC